MEEMIEYSKVPFSRRDAFGKGMGAAIPKRHMLPQNKKICTLIQSNLCTYRELPFLQNNHVKAWKMRL